MPSSGRTWLASFLLAACGGGADLGEPCGSPSACDDGLQCLAHVCVPRCERHTDCGDGHICRSDGVCEAVDSEIGELCEREVDCAPGQACHLLDEDLDGDGLLTASCQPEVSGGVLDDPCRDDDDCRTGTCVIGRCVDLCLTELDCPETHLCTSMPREIPGDLVGGTANASFFGCLPARGTIRYDVPIVAPYQRFFLPVPGTAQAVAMVATVEDPAQLVGAALVESPAGDVLYELPFTRDEYFANALRHDVMPGVATLLIPQVPGQLEAGAYAVEIGSYLGSPQVPGTEVPDVEIIYKLDPAVTLDLHFHFLDLSDHPCSGGVTGAASAATSVQFQDVYLRELNLIFARAGVVVDRDNGVTYEDILDRPDLDGLDVSRLGDLLELAETPGGMHVFFVRSIAPAGLQALAGGPPAPPGVPGTRASGVVVAMDTLCYRPDWARLARITAHEIARALGLHRTIEPDRHVDPIEDSDFDPSNLMHFSDLGGDELSDDQRAILRGSAALR